MSNIIDLPTAAKTLRPQKSHHGKYPKNVIPGVRLSQARYLRNHPEAAAALEAQRSA